MTLNKAGLRWRLASWLRSEKPRYPRAEASDFVAVAKAEDHPVAFMIQAEAGRKVQAGVITYLPCNHWSDVMRVAAHAELVRAAQPAVEFGAGYEVFTTEAALVS